MTPDAAHSSLAERSPRVTRIALAIAPPVIGVVYLVLWILAETGRSGLGAKVVVFAALALAIGIAGRLPRIALAIIVLVPLLQFLGVVPPPESTTWPMYEAFAIVGFFAGVRRDIVAWPYAIGTGIVATMLAAMNMVFPHSLWPPSVGGVAPSLTGFPLSPRYGWVSWIGQGRIFEPMGLRDTASMYAVVIGETLFLIAVGSVLYLLAWAAGQALSLRGVERAVDWTRAQLSRADGELRREQERAAIARDVHDTLAHSLAVVVAQAEGGIAAAASDGEAATRSLAVIAEVSREALIDCRSLVERIQDETGTERPQPTASDIPALLERMRGLGMHVAYQELGDAQPLSASRQLALYRITQESLTNALKHGGSDSVVTVTADWRGAGLALLIASRSDLEGSGQGGGAGLAGMRERARLAGGWLSAGPSEDGVFLVTAYIPVDVQSVRVAEAADA
ncbi:sensor histidine kinase [Rathayibacter sp. CAU 1779]